VQVVPEQLHQAPTVQTVRIHNSANYLHLVAGPLEKKLLAYRAARAAVEADPVLADEN
jgi:hypothetical protein